MQLAFTTLACPQWSLEQVIEAAQHNQYDGLELRLLDGEILSASLDQSARTRVQMLCRQAQLQIICVDTSVRIADPDPEVRSVQYRDGMAFLEMAAEWEAPFIRVFGAPPASTPATEAIKAAVECLAPLAERGQQLGVTVLLETHDAFSSTVAVMDVLKQIPAAGALWDILHPYRLGESVTETANRLGNRCHHIHVKDGCPAQQGGENWELRLLGDGVIPVPEILATLKSQHYDGWLSVEWEKKWHPEIAEPELAIPQHTRVLREYLAQL